MARQVLVIWIELARFMASRMRRQPDFRIMGPNTLGICNFRWEPVGPDGNLMFSAAENDELNQMLDEYYEARGWDVQTGAPSRKKLEELGLGYVADHLSV